MSKARCTASCSCRGLCVFGAAMNAWAKLSVRAVQLKPGNSATDEIQSFLERDNRKVQNPEHIWFQQSPCPAARPTKLDRRASASSMPERLTYDHDTRRHRRLYRRPGQKAWEVDGPRSRTLLSEIKTVGIIGAGTMGGGIAMNFATAGFDVKIVENQTRGAGSRPCRCARQLSALQRQRAVSPRRSRSAHGAVPRLLKPCGTGRV